MSIEPVVLDLRVECQPSRQQLLLEVVYALSYQWLGVSFYHWYVGPLLPASTLLVGLGAASRRDLVAGFAGARPAVVVPGLLVLPLLLPGLSPETRWRSHPYHDGRIANYEAAGRWLAAHAPPDAVVEAMEIGVIGYYARRPMIDFAGLTRPEIARRLQDRDVAWSVFHYSPDYVVLIEDAGFDSWLMEQERFRQAYTRVFRTGEEGQRPVAVYHLSTEELPTEVRGQSVGASFDRVAELRLVDVERLVVRQGDAIRLMLHWTVEAPQPGKYSSFVHVLDTSWKLHAQSDNWLDVTEWPSGATFRDPHVLHLPASIPPGRYRLNVGLYEREPFRNLKTRGPEGETTTLTIAVIEVRAE